MNFNIKEIIIVYFSLQRIVLKVLYYVSLFFVIPFFLKADAGTAIPIASSCLEKDFETTLQGKGSYVLRINSLGNFSNYIMQNEKPVMLRCFCHKNEKEIVDWYQQLADEMKERIQSYSLNLEANNDIAKYMLAITLNLLQSYKMLISKSPFLFDYLQNIIQRIAGLEKKETFSPFILFFYKGSLVITSHECVDKESTYKAILACLEYSEKSMITTTSSVDSKPKISLWNKIKSIFKK